MPYNSQFSSSGEWQVGEEGRQWRELSGWLLVLFFGFFFLLILVVDQGMRSAPSLVAWLSCASVSVLQSCYTKLHFNNTSCSHGQGHILAPCLRACCHFQSQTYRALHEATHIYSPIIWGSLYLNLTTHEVNCVNMACEPGWFQAEEMVSPAKGTRWMLPWNKALSVSWFFGFFFPASQDSSHNCLLRDPLRFAL